MLAADFEMLACVGDLDRAVRLSAAAERIRDETGYSFTLRRSSPSGST